MGSNKSRKRKAPATEDLSTDNERVKIINDEPAPSKRNVSTKSAALTKGSSVKFVMILSPAKTLDTSPMVRNEPIPWTLPSCDVSKTKELTEIMKQHSVSSLKKLLSISDNLATTAKQYWDEMTDESSGKPCIFAFQGAAYQGLSIDTIPDTLSTLNYLQGTLRIIDPLYGWLRPMDEIQPYRLEMATRNILPHQKLADYWKPSIQESIHNEKGDSIWILNLASEEYSAAVDYPEKMIKVVFRHEGRIISIHAKRARGLMVRYCAIHQISDTSQLIHFAEEGYRYQPNKSDETTFIFDRSKNWNQASKNK